MALILLAGTAYAAYRSYQLEEEKEDAKHLEGTTPVTLLPIEQTLGYLEAPMSTITYLDGDYRVAAEHLSRRVEEILAKNPWAGGWVATGKGEKREVKLWYDGSGEGRVAPGTFHVYEPGEVQLMSDTRYEDYQRLAETYLAAAGDEGRRVKILTTSALKGKNIPPWQVSIVPVADRPDDRFVLVVSMSRVLGDPHTFYRLYEMLSQDADVVALNPKRNLECSEILMEHLGREEAFYIKNATTNPLWEWTQKEQNPTEIRMFYISEQWLITSLDEDKNDFENTYEYSFLTSWFFNSLKPTVGMLAFDYRNKLPNCKVTETDAGNYCSSIPLTAADYFTPNLVLKSLATHRRCGSHPPAPLPGFQWDATFSFTTDWSKYLRKQINLGENVAETLHLPFYNAADLSVIPNKLSALFLFTARPGSEDASVKRRLGALVVAPRSAIATIENCGIAGEMIAEF